MALSMQSTNITVDDSSFTHHTSCPSCKSSDANGVYSDGHTYCFSCRVSTKGNTDTPKVTSKMTSGLIPNGEYQDLPRRGLREDVCKKYGYSIGEYQGQPCHIANYRDKDGVVVAQKLRFKDKTFKFIGDAKEATLFGEHLFKGGDNTLVITEGEIDALSMATVLTRFSVCSIPTGASGAKKAIQKSLEFVESFNKIVICFDNDEAGIAASKEVVQLLTPSKAFIMSLPLKDANEMLVANKHKELVSAFFDARPWRPDGIVAGEDLWDLVSTEDITQSIPYPFEGLNEKTRGIRRGELVTIAAGSGVGKSQVCREIAFHLLNMGETVGYIGLEENVKHSALTLMGLALNKPIHISREGINDRDLRHAFDATVGSGRLYLYDHWGSLATATLLQKVRYLARSCAAGYIILDHLSILVSSQEEGDERKAIDAIMTRLRSLVEETGIALILVSHLRKPSGDKGWEDGVQVTLNSLRGSAGIAQLSDICLGVERDQQGDNPNVSTIRILKNRYTGETGVGCYVHYDKDTGRMTDVKDPTVFKDESSHINEDF
jgi:twinkle protein